MKQHHVIDVFSIYPEYDIYDHNIELYNTIPTHKKAVLLFGVFVLSTVCPTIIFLLYLQQ
jgi:hypothetical protein